ncbi:drug/metabolite transporter (DMT)-like permease [Actinophytocola algeriensis]|uniref:Drug/metabolite transporter (DMT)-like permease n=1 Tax=Actinophytocola algeriensis TaxID=1768010 RepID=A0A7W7VC34_9PSEU|nr:drug/metabolite transporter (DMT)-like permease [Actinophytocola algeriensis]MBE1476490.1 drug/metabolite transporter (DMT)-like permease [Actinophytocola algeriensis]
MLSAAFAHAGWNIFAKRVPDGGALFVWLAAVWGVVFQLPLAIVMVARDGMAASWWLAFGVSGVIHLGYFVLLQRGYRVGDLSVVYPLARGTGPLLTVVAAVWFLGERPGAVALVGAVGVVAGVFVIGGLGTGAGMGYGLATGALIASYTLWDAHAVTALAVPPVILMCGSALVESVLLAPYALARREAVGRIWRDHKAAVLAVAVLSPLAYVLVLFAMRLAPVSLVAPARELSIVVGSLGAWLLLGEPNPLRRLTGAVIVLAGVAAIAVS